MNNHERTSLIRDQKNPPQMALPKKVACLESA